METWHAPDEDRKAKQSKRNEPSSSGPAPQKSATEGLSNRGMQSVVPGLQLQLKGTGGAVLDETIATAIHSKRGSGEHLDSAAAEKIGKSMGQDFSDVQVHKDGEADKLNKQVHAEAFTTGKDIFFREGKYDPVSDQGQKLLAHELTHVVQQRNAPASSELRVSDPNEASEKQAEKTAEKVTAPTGSSTASAGGAGGSVGRVEEDELATNLDRAASQEEEKEEGSGPMKDMAMSVAPQEAPGKEEEGEEAAAMVARQESPGKEEEGEEAAAMVARQEAPGKEEEGEEAAAMVARQESPGKEEEGEEAAAMVARQEAPGKEEEGEEAAAMVARQEAPGKEEEGEEAAAMVARQATEEEGAEKESETG